MPTATADASCGLVPSSPSPHAARLDALGAAGRLAAYRDGERVRRSEHREASIAWEISKKTMKRPLQIERWIDRDRDLDRGFGIE